MALWKEAGMLHCLLPFDEIMSVPKIEIIIKRAVRSGAKVLQVGFLRSYHEVPTR